MEYGDPIRGVVRKELARLGVTHVDAAEIDGLALDVCTDLFRRARSWDPSHGVLPWTWARLRVCDPRRPPRRPVRRPAARGRPGRGHRGRRHRAARPGRDDESILFALERLADVRSDLRLLHEALDRVSRPAQQEILFEVRMQAGQGDPSPATTVARAYALSPRRRPPDLQAPRRPCPPPGRHRPLLRPPGRPAPPAQGELIPPARRGRMGLALVLSKPDFPGGFRRVLGMLGPGWTSPRVW